MKPLIIANWKMNPATLAEAKQLFNLVKKDLKKIKDIKAEVISCPPFPYLSFLSADKSSNLELGGQNCFSEEKGAFTGEISALMLKDFGCQYVILGHSERRRHFSETDEMINKKIKAAIKTKLFPIFCIGESQTEKEKSLTKEVIKSQIKKGLRDITKSEVKKIIIAYEPVWAIGTGKSCCPSEAGEIGNFIRKIISQIYNKKIAKGVKVIYGGSVNSQNSAFYISGGNLQGLLVGGASLNAEEFIKITKSIINLKNKRGS